MPRFQRIVLASRPLETGPAASNFRLEEFDPAPLRAGEVLLETLYLSLDPYMRARMYDGPNYTAGVPLGDPMPGATVSRVVRSLAPRLSEGTIVESWHGWQSHHVCTVDGLRAIDPLLAPISTALGVLGMPGHTGYGGMVRHGRPKSGETVVVSAAAGAVGAVAGQVARLAGCRVVGIVGGAEKCAILVDEFGFDAAVDRRSPDLAAALSAACPKGVDIYFDTVGGDVLLAVMPLLNVGARVPICGTIAVDRNRGVAVGGDRLPEMHATILVKRLTLQGFLYSDMLDISDEFRQRMSAWIRSGEVRYREHVVNGLDSAPEAFLGLFRGENVGKLLVRMTDADEMRREGLQGGAFDPIDRGNKDGRT